MPASIRVLMGSLILTASQAVVALASAPDVIMTQRQMISVVFDSTVSVAGWAPWSERVESWRSRGGHVSALQRTVIQKARECQRLDIRSGRDGERFDYLIAEFELGPRFLLEARLREWPLLRARVLAGELERQGETIEFLRIEKRVSLIVPIAGVCSHERSRYIFWFRLRGRPELKVEELLPWISTSRFGSGVTAGASAEPPVPAAPPSPPAPPAPPMLPELPVPPSPPAPPEPLLEESFFDFDAE